MGKREAPEACPFGASCMYPIGVDSDSFRGMSPMPPPEPDATPADLPKPGEPVAGSPIVRLQLLSPTHRRIWSNWSIINTETGEWAWKKRAAMTTKALLESKPPWTIYRGPGVTDERGWFIPSSDPGIDPPRR